MQCRNAVSMRAEFVLEFHKDLKKVKVEGLSDEKLRSFIEDIRKCLGEDTEDLETKQQAIGMKCLFREFSMKSWVGSDFSDNKFTGCNGIVDQHCMDCC